MDESGTDAAECHRMVSNGRKVAGAIRFLVNARCLQLEYVIVLHEAFLMSILLYGNETMIWGEKERSVGY